MRIGMLASLTRRGLLASLLAGFLVAAFAAEPGSPPQPAPAVTEPNTTNPPAPGDPRAETVVNPPPVADCKDCAYEERKRLREIQVAIISGAMLFIVIVSAALYRYIKALRDQMAALAAGDKDARKLFLQMGLGVPDGTIRSALAVLIVIGALLALIAALTEDLGLEVPEALTGVFGTILGFYFGRAGSVETSQATAVMADAAQATSQANKEKVQAAKEVAAANASADAAVKTASASRLKAVESRIDPITRAMDSIIAFAPAALLGDSAAKWKQLRETLATTARAGSLDQLEAALDQVSKEGPVATLLRQVSPALSAMAQPGQTATDVARALIEFNVTLAPEVAQRWALRVLGLPFRRELIDPVIDEGYATDLIRSSPIASRILADLQAGEPASQLSATSLVSTVLSDDAFATLTEELAGSVAPEDVGAMVDQLQKRAVEQQLEHDIPVERAAAFGGLRALLEAIDRVRLSDEGQLALDVLLGIVRRARAVGVPIADLLSPKH